MRPALAVLMLSCPLAAQSIAVAAAVRAMERSIAKQRASVARMATAVISRSARPHCEPLPETKLSPLLRAAGEKTGVKPELLHAVIEVESAFSPCAVSPKGAMGLMQLMPATAGQLGVRNPFDARQNVDAGAKWLKQLLTRYGGDLALALGAYNAGPNAVDQAGDVPAVAETTDYVRQVLSLTAAPF